MKCQKDPSHIQTWHELNRLGKLYESPINDIFLLQWSGSVYNELVRSHVQTVETFVKMTYFSCSGQGMFMIEHNADMYRLWRYLFQIGERTNFAWIHGFRTNVHNGFVSLDDYDGKNS